MTDPNEWLSWNRRLSLHESYLRRWDYFILRDSLTLTATSALIRWKGALVCQDGIEIRVTLTLDVDDQSGRQIVRTRKYSYQVLRRVEGVERGLFRYDNAHPHPGHPDWHHRHAYDRDGREIKPPEHVGYESAPTLGDVLSQAYGVWEEMQRVP